jgi:transcriptional regulator with XRE-family HTH domain
MGGNDFSRRFGQRLREIRSSKGMSQEQLAHAAGLHRTHVSLIECNRRSVRLETLERLAKALDVQPAQLLPTLGKPFNAAKARSPSRQGKTG